MRGLWVLAAVVGLPGCGEKGSGQDSANLTAIDASVSSALAKLDHDSSEKLPPYDKLPPVPVNGFCTSDDHGKCDMVRLQMLEAWPKAWSGDYQAQRNVAFMLSAPTVGIPLNPVQGCAWRMVILASGDSQADSTDTANYSIECGKLTEVELATSKASAGEIFKTIKGQTLPELPSPAA